MKKLASNTHLFLVQFLFCFYFIALTPQVFSKDLLFRNAIDQMSLHSPIAHFTGLEGNYSIQMHSQASLKSLKPSLQASAIVPLLRNPNSTLHGFYFMPSYIFSNGYENGSIQHAGSKAWTLTVGRANLNIKDSIFKGFLQIGYRRSQLNSDHDSSAVVSKYALNKDSERRSSLLLNTGVASQQNDLVAQKRPRLDSSLQFNLRYDYEKGDLFGQIESKVFFPWVVDLGANVSWFKSFRNKEELLYAEVSDDIAWGPAARMRIQKNILVSTSCLWHAYKNFQNEYIIPGPTLQLSAALSF